MPPSTLVVVDGHNLLNDVGRCLSQEAKAGESPHSEIRHRYYRDWFDVDRLVEATFKQQLSPMHDLGIVIFHSKKNPGESDWEIGASETVAFWGRQGSNDNTSTRLIHVEGGPPGKDTGVDTAIVLYLIETSARWDSAVLFTHDADFVPAVWALRDQGKRVFCATRVADRASPIVQACQHFYPWDVGFLRADRALFQVLQPGAELDTFLKHPQIAVRQPWLRVAGSGLAIGAHLGGLADNEMITLNELLRPTGTVFADGGNVERRGVHTGGLTVSLVCDMGTPPKWLPGREFVARGLARHADLFKSAHWYTLLEKD